MSSFKILGTFSVTGRGLVAYGDILEGTVHRGDSLLVRLNSGLSLAVPIQSVEAVDWPNKISHVGLLLGSSDELELAVLQGLNLADEVVEISEPYLGTTFEEALIRLSSLLSALAWPTHVTWLARSQFLSLPRQLVVFRPGSGTETAETARQNFNFIAASAVAVRVAALGHTRDTSFATLCPITALGQGEEMFIENGVKVDAPKELPVVVSIESKAWWWFYRLAYKRRKKRLHPAATA